MWNKKMPWWKKSQKYENVFIQLRCNECLQEFEWTWIFADHYQLLCVLLIDTKELLEGDEQNFPSRMLRLCLLWKNIREFSILSWGRATLLRRRLERVVHNEVRLLRLSHWGRRQMGRGPEQQLPQSVLQLHSLQEEPWRQRIFRQGRKAVLQEPRKIGSLNERKKTKTKF